MAKKSKKKFEKVVESETLADIEWVVVSWVSALITGIIFFILNAITYYADPSKVFIYSGYLLILISFGGIVLPIVGVNKKEYWVEVDT